MPNHHHHQPPLPTTTLYSLNITAITRLRDEEELEEGWDAID
jgi:hypothetical protein